MTVKEEKVIITPPPPVTNEKPPQRRSQAFWICTAIILIVALIWFFFWLFYLRFHESTDDAYANGNRVYINSAVNGSVIAFYADDTDLVTEGQLLVQLDTVPFTVAFERELATLSNVVLQVKQIYDSVKVNLANVETRKALASKAEYDYQNRQKVVDSLAISQEEFIHSRDDLLVAQLQLKQAEYEYQIAKDLAGNTAPQNHPLVIQQRNNVRQAYYNLRHCSIYAPCTGYVAQRSVEVGRSVIRESNLMAIIPKDYVWVDANFKETQLSKMRIGQPAVVWFDLYGSGVKYDGKVLGIASGTGSVFSLIPPQNATGNWIKIVQRLPVRISLDKKTLKDYPTRLGISAQVNVNVTNQDLPLLAPVPSTELVSETNVFDIDFKEVDELINAIIHEHLNPDTI
jgi:membrane fusion protein, multidrug efflux system